MPGGTAAGGSWIVMVCPTPGVLSLGCSFTTLSAAHREMHCRLQPQEQVTSHGGLTKLVNGSWASTAAMSRQLALTGPLGGPLGVPLLPCLADLLLPRYRYRPTIDDSSHEHPGQQAP